MLGMPDELARIRLLHADRCRALHTEYGRCLPFGDATGDRWDKAEHLRHERGVSIGATVSLYDSASVFFAGGLAIGEGTWIGPNVLLDGAHAPLTIGSWVTVCAGVQIYTHDSIAWALTGGNAAYDSAPTSIGSRCHLGPNVVVAKGVTIGDGCVVLANSVVTKDVEPGSVVAGSPAVMKFRAVVESGSYRFERAPANCSTMRSASST